jgi:lysophospholipase L1-like esterase
MPEPRDDSLMNRFDREGLRRFRARDAVLAVFLAAVILVVADGSSMLKTGHEMNSGVGRDTVLAVARPADWIARQLPVADVAHTATSWLNPEPNLGGGGFATPAALAQGQIPPVTPSSFDPEALGEPPGPRRPLHTLLVTGDSMSMPLDSDLAEALVEKHVHVIQDPHIGTGISTTFVVNWAKLAAAQARSDHPDAVVVFIGANDGFPMTGPEGREVSCCSAAWAAIYGNRVREVMNTYRQAGAHVYWMTLPAPRDSARARIARVVNAAIEVAAQPWAAQVQVFDTVPVFTPGFAYRDAMTIGGTQTIVRQADGIHLNEAGSRLLARDLLEKMSRQFTY